MLGRLTISLSTDEHEALLRMAQAECRHPRDQLRFLLREEACKRGLLASDEPSEEKFSEQEGRADEPYQG